MHIMENIYKRQRYEHNEKWHCIVSNEQQVYNTPQCRNNFNFNFLDILYVFK